MMMMMMMMTMLFSQNYNLMRKTITMAEMLKTAALREVGSDVVVRVNKIIVSVGMVITVNNYSLVLYSFIFISVQYRYA